MSESADSPLQVRIVLVVIPELGAMETPLSVGVLLSSVTVAVSPSVPPSESSAVTAHWMTSIGEAMLLDKVMVSLVPKAAPVVRFVQV